MGDSTQQTGDSPSTARRVWSWLTPERVLYDALAAILLILGYGGSVNGVFPQGRGSAVIPTISPLEGVAARICGVVSVLAGLWLIATAHAIRPSTPTSETVEHHEDIADGSSSTGGFP